MKSTITTIILTYNEARHIERCVQNVLQVSERVIVVDSFSSDDTCALARQAGAEVVQHEYVNQAQQFQWALEHSEITSEWTMRIDADEYLTDELIAEIRNILTSLTVGVTGVNFTLRVKFLNRYLRHGYIKPVRLLRLWRTGCVYMEQRWMDERCVLTQGEAVNFKGLLVDENLNGLTAWTQKHNNYSNREIVAELDKQYHFFSASESEDLKGRNAQKGFYYRLPRFLRAFAYFFTRYFLFLGFLDGVAGLVWATLQAYWYRFLVDAKLYEMEKRLGKSPTKQEVVAYIESNFGIQIK